MTILWSRRREEPVELVRLTVKVPVNSPRAVRLARLFRDCKLAAIRKDLPLGVWLVEALEERRDRLIAEGRWKRGKGSEAERAAGCQGGDHRGGAGKGGRS